MEPLPKDLEAYLDGANEDDGETRKKITEGQRKKLLDPRTWTVDHQLRNIASRLWEAIGGDLFEDHNAFRDLVDEVMKRDGIKTTAAEKKKIYDAVSWRDEAAPPVIKKVTNSAMEPDPLHGLHEATVGGSFCVVEYEPDPELRDTEQVPLLEEGGVEAFFKREVLPHALDAWIDDSKTRIGYEINFNRHFFKPTPLRTLEEIQADIQALEEETGGLLEQIIVQTESVR